MGKRLGRFTRVLASAGLMAGAPAQAAPANVDVRDSPSARSGRTKVLRQGSHSVHFRPKTLRPGRYRVKLETTDLEGNAAKPVTKRFTVPPPRSG